MMENEDLEAQGLDSSELGLDNSSLEQSNSNTDFVSSSNTDIPSSSIENSELPSETQNLEAGTSPENGETLKEKLDDNKNYQKSNSGREAYSKTLDNKDYYNDKKQENQNRQLQNKIDTDKNKEKKDSAEKRLEEAKSKKRNSTGRRSKEDKKELKEAKKDEKEQSEKEKDLKKEEKQLKKDEKNIAKDSKKSERFKKLHPVQAAQMQLQNKLKKLKKIIISKLLTIFAPIIIGLVLCFVVIEIILGPILDAFGHIDEALTGVANFAEKLENFYNGFGFQNSKEAFYEELNELQKRYGDNLNAPLLLSTLFYTEGMGYETKFQNAESENAVDPSIGDYGSNKGIWSAGKDYLRNKYEESKQTVDENGLVYNVGKIYRLRKLARNQFAKDGLGLTIREGAEQCKPLREYIKDFEQVIGKDIYRLFQDILAAFFSSLTAPFNEALANILGSEDYKGEYFDRLRDISDDFSDTLKNLIGDIFYGFASITKIKVDFLKNACYKDEKGNENCDLKLISVDVYYRDFKFSSENYNKYLKDYYFEQIPEFRQLLGGLTGAAREEKKNSILREIYANEKLFRDIYLQYADASSEEYIDACVGAIPNKLVKELQTPVSISEDYIVDFFDEYSFGISSDGTKHNGVDLNKYTVGIEGGSDVYAIRDGTITSVDVDVGCDSVCYKTIRIDHETTIDNETYKYTSVYSHVSVTNINIVEGYTVNKGELLGKVVQDSNTGETGLHFEFIDRNNSDGEVAIDPTNLFISCVGSSTFAGANNEEATYNYLIGKGYPKQAVAGIVANMSTESADTFDGRIVQGDIYGGGQVTDISIEYTNKVDSGVISKEDFIKNGPNGGGYGIVQWTYKTLKEGLYNYIKNNGSSIGDTALQLDYLYKIFTEGDSVNGSSFNYKSLNDRLMSPTITYDSATRDFMLNFERPSDQTLDAQNRRVDKAEKIYKKYAQQ